MGISAPQPLWACRAACRNRHRPVQQTSQKPDLLPANPFDGCSGNGAPGYAHSHPALAVLLTRAVINRERGVDSGFLLERQRELRTGLGLRPVDIAEAVYDEFLNREGDIDYATDEAAHAVVLEAERLRSELESLSVQSRGLEIRVSQASHALRAKTQEAQHLREQLGDAAEHDGETESRLRAKVQRLSQLLDERHAERKELRQQLAQLSSQQTHRKPASTTDVGEPDPESEDDDATDTNLVEAREFAHHDGRSRIPEFASTARKDLEAFPPSMTPWAVRAASDIARGVATRGTAVKRIAQREGIYSARLGRRHRMIFTMSDSLVRVLRVCSRKNFETVLSTMTEA